MDGVGGQEHYCLFPEKESRPQSRPAGISLPSKECRLICCWYRHRCRTGDRTLWCSLYGKWVLTTDIYFDSSSSSYVNWTGKMFSTYNSKHLLNEVSRIKKKFQLWAKLSPCGVVSGPVLLNDTAQLQNLSGHSLMGLTSPSFRLGPCHGRPVVFVGPLQRLLLRLLGHT